MSVGIYTLSKDEYNSLGLDTAQLSFRNMQGHYVVALEMFHQLHCLVSSDRKFL